MKSFLYKRKLKAYNKTYLEFEVGPIGKALGLVTIKITKLMKMNNAIILEVIEKEEVVA